MYKEILRNIDNIAIWPVLSFVIFFLFFLLMLWWIFSADKSYLDEMEDKPLHDGTHPQTANPNLK